MFLYLYVCLCSRVGMKLGGYTCVCAMSLPVCVAWEHAECREQLSACLSLSVGLHT